ncbi:MAG: tRNA (guanosine(46)-N7)-methyltransferase TrmB [Gammaproteobacteria bacterium]|nr:MAG: tRNA (guanosine(46)-N7)-methyltransferase TrmB [Gammaproteobacteria bacterium]
MTNQPTRRRTIRSFVRRASRVTNAQRRALDELWPKHGIDYTAHELDICQLFGRHAPIVLEIGFGNGELLVSLAAANPARNFIGIEVHEPGVGHCLLAIETARLTNVRLSRHDAIDVLRQQVPDAALSRINLFFSDPWPKKRHHKRRIVQPDFVALLVKKIEIGGLFHVATDWADYAEHINAIVLKNKAFTPVEENGPARPETKFELRGKRLGHEIWEQRYRRV